MRIVSGSLVVAATFGLVACTEPGETTTMAAATGGAIGAGLGALIGSQTGSAGGGLVLGALAGGAAGGAFGNALEAQEKAIRTQDEAIERQERTIAAQRTELDELRRLNQEPQSARIERHMGGRAESPIQQQDVYVPHASFGGVQPRAAVPTHDIRASQNMAVTAPSAVQQQPAAAMRESTLIDRSAEYQGRGINNHHVTDVRPNVAAPSIQNAQENAAVVARMGTETASMPRSQAMGATTGAVPARANQSSMKPSTPECIQAEGEINKANGSNELADKLFHYRRALRLCPDNPAYHNGLGEIYLALNRKADAEFEFREALNVDPNYMPAQNNLNNIR